MSGTSADGVDVALVRIAGSGYEMKPTLLLHHHRPYSPDIRRAIFDARSGRPLALRELAQLAREISLAYAQCIHEALLAQKLSPSRLAGIAAHGQTLFHDPPLTIQWLDPALLAEKTGCPVVSDFRRADCAAGGQGAPLVPFADFILFRHPKRNRVLANIGGIANITFLPAAGAPADVLAFDTGPGNCLSDYLMRRFDSAGPGYDAAGQRALSGTPNPEIVAHVINDPFFRHRPPKSTDGPAMIAILDPCIDQCTPFKDLLATACQITASALADAIQQFLPAPPDELILSGGGIHNRAIMNNLRQALPTIPITTSDEHGVKSQAKEALAFALLGLATLDGIPANIPSATGASRAVVLGTVTPKP